MKYIVVKTKHCNKYVHHQAPGFIVNRCASMAYYSDVNEAFKWAEEYNKTHDCGCRVDVKEIV